MGFYIRKAFNFGPFRLNLSKKGIGTSVGVKGLRISSGPRGTELHAGRYGLYYREKLADAPATPESYLPPLQTDGSEDDIPPVQIASDQSNRLGIVILAIAILGLVVFVLFLFFG